MDNNRENVSRLFMILCVLFVICLLLSNVIAGKIFTFGGMSLSAAVILFPTTYILGDVFTEVYGFQKTKLVIWIGFVCNLFAVVIYIATIALPYPNFWVGQEAFVTVFATTPKVLFASSLGYLFGGFLNSIVLSALKVKMYGKNLWIRTVFSTVVGEAIDTTIFICISFGGTVENEVLFQMVLFQYLWKVCYETVFLPVTYVVVKWLKTYENVDVYDEDVKYNIF